MENYYRILGLKSEATLNEVEKRHSELLILRLGKQVGWQIREIEFILKLRILLLAGKLVLVTQEVLQN